MAYEQPDSSSDSSKRTHAAHLRCGGVGSGRCWRRSVLHAPGRSAPVPVAKKAPVSQPSAPQPPAAVPAPEPVAAPPDASAQAATPAQTPAQPVAVEQSQPVASALPVPAVVTGPATTDSRPESRPDPRNTRRQEKSAVVAKQPDLASSRRPVMPNLKIGSPSAPNKNLANPGEGAAPATEIASNEAMGSVPPAGLLTSAGRTSNPPAPPPSALAPPAPASVAAPRIVQDAKLISSARAIYPAAAKAIGRSGKRHGCRKRRCDWKGHRGEGAERTDASPGSGCKLGETVEIFTRPGRRKTRCFSCDRQCRIQVELVRPEFFLLLPFPITIRAGQPGRWNNLPTMEGFLDWVRRAL